jgi:hypothetical protein
MKTEKKIERAELNLQRKLDWVGRHDNRVIFATGIIVAMLGVLSSAASQIKAWACWQYFLFGITGLLLLVALLAIYYSQFPKTKSNNFSLIFFSTISTLTLEDFGDKVKSTTNKEYLEDLLCQIHTNSQILEVKFKNLKLAMTLLAFAIIPWLFAIYVSNLYVK